MNSLDGHKLMQIWQFDHFPEKTLRDICVELKDLGYTGVLVKSLDGINLMSNFDNSPESINGIEKIQRQVELVHSLGMIYCSWTVPLVEKIDLQADFTGQIANIVDALFIDAEPYAEFWGAWRDVGLAKQYMETIRSVSPNGYIVLQPDPRTARLLELRPEEWIPYVNAISGQHYFNDFGRSPQEEVEKMLSVRDMWGKPIYPTLPGNAPNSHLSSCVELMIQNSIKGLVVWRYGSTPIDSLRTIGQYQFLPIKPPVDESMLQSVQELLYLKEQLTLHPFRHSDLYKRKGRSEWTNKLTTIIQVIRGYMGS